MIISAYWLLVPLVLIVGSGLAVMVYFIRGLRESLQAQNWPQAQGRILQLHRELVHGEGPVRHEIKVSYKYQVDSRDFIGTRISRFYRASCELDIQHLLKQKLANAAHVTVYYKPGKPECGMLAPGYHNGAVTGIGVGLLIASLCLMFTFLLLHSLFDGRYVQAIHVVQP